MKDLFFVSSRVVVHPRPAVSLGKLASVKYYTLRKCNKIKEKKKENKMNETESFGMFTPWRIDVSDPDALLVWLAFQILLPLPQSFSPHHAHHPVQIDCEATLQAILIHMHA